MENLNTKSNNNKSNKLYTKRDNNKNEVIHILRSGGGILQKLMYAYTEYEHVLLTIIEDKHVLLIIGKCEIVLPLNW